ncbi:MAG: beta-glucanase [Gemmatimonadetes bacterium]|nr:beta-glucanase [Gemmatimonadota bacterium]
MYFANRWIALSATCTMLMGCASWLGHGPELPRAANGERYQLAFADEFDGDGPLDPAHWSFETGFVRNQELQWYQPENAVRMHGVLLIEGRREHKPNPRYVAPSAANASAPAAPNRRGWANREFIEYTSASANTRGKHAWLYGRFEMRARIDVRRGSWPAFWTLGARGPWPANGEIDIMEFYDDTLLFNVAWGGANGATWNSVKRERSTMPAGWENEFHVWRMDWDARSIKLYLDDVLMNAQDLAATMNAPRAAAQGGNAALKNPFHGPAYLLVNQALGGQHGGDPATTALPIRYEIDYVRVYQTPSQMEATRRALASDAR